ncbi:hypothetical protein Lal_00002592 [Lupinus albus]|nr:hypothetical protein Lal_00002592 [Lupinus albus]
MESEGHTITLEDFKGKFLQKYFLVDLKRKREMEFLQLEQRDMSVGDYEAKFEELPRYCPYYELEVDGRSKSAKFEFGLKPKLKMIFGHQEISDFPTLVNKCVILGMFAPDSGTNVFIARSGTYMTLQVKSANVIATSFSCLCFDEDKVDLKSLKT